MTHDDDLIRRGDALNEVRPYGSLADITQRIRALPAVTPAPAPDVVGLVHALRHIDSITVHSGGDVHGVTADIWKAAFEEVQAVARAALAAMEGGVEEPISDGRLECDDLCARFMSGEASEKEVVDTIKKVARANERLAVLLGEAKAAARYSVSAEWAAKMLPADEGATPAAGGSNDEAAYHIETAISMARVQDGYARKTTCEGEKIIFKANANAQRQIANYIRRISAPAPAPDVVGLDWKSIAWRLRSYAVHDNECKVNKPPHFDVTKCTCGLRAALAAMEDGKNG